MTAKHPLLTKLRKLNATLPETAEVEAWEHPTFRAGKKIYATLGVGKDGLPTISCKQTQPDQSALVTDPRFRVADYVGKHGWITLDADRVPWPLVEELVLKSYRLIALKRMVKALDAQLADG